MVDGEYALILEEYEPIPPDDLAPVLKSCLGMLHFDAMRHARGSRGIVMERLSRTFADALHAGLAEAGFRTRIITQEGVIAVDQPQTVRTIGLRDDALDVYWGYTGGPQPIPWENVFLISAGEIVNLEGEGGADGRRARGRASARGSCRSWLRASGWSPAPSNPSTSRRAPDRRRARTRSPCTSRTSSPSTRSGPSATSDWSRGSSATTRSWGPTTSTTRCSTSAWFCGASSKRLTTPRCRNRPWPAWLTPPPMSIPMTPGSARRRSSPSTTGGC